jgi:hypothetical protein
VLAAGPRQAFRDRASQGSQHHHPLKRDCQTHAPPTFRPSWTASLQVVCGWMADGKRFGPLPAGPEALVWWEPWRVGRKWNRGGEGEHARPSPPFRTWMSTSKPKTRATRLQDLQMIHGPRVKQAFSYSRLRPLNPYYCIASISTSVIGAHEPGMTSAFSLPKKDSLPQMSSHTSQTRGKSTNTCWTRR